jgi:signal transduction histidine kinase
MTGGGTADTREVLLVEDNPGDARLIEELLKEVDHRPAGGHVEEGVETTFRHADTLSNGLDRLAGEPVDVLLLDLGLPESRGIETLERVLEAEADVPIVVLTGQPESDLGVEAVSRGAQEYLVKDDVTPEVLARTIEYAIERKAVERQLRRRNEELAILNHLTRHDIRNDVSLVVGRARELRENVEPSYDGLVDEIVNSSNHVLQLTRTIGDIVESISREGEPDLQPVDLGRILESEVETARSLYSGGVIAVEGAPADVDVRANELLSSVFANLFGNAMLYNDKETPEVTVTAEVAEDTATVHVADNGPGIPEYQRERLFEAPESGMEASTSVGLYLVGRLVEQYGGEVGVENREAGGAVFHVTLPRA